MKFWGRICFFSNERILKILDLGILRVCTRGARAASNCQLPPVIADQALSQSNFLNGVFTVMRVAVTSPVIAREGFPLMSYA